MKEINRVLRLTVLPALVTAALITGIRYASKGPSEDAKNPNKPHFGMYLTDTAFHVGANNWKYYKEINCEDDGIDCSWDNVTFTDWSYGGSGGIQSDYNGSSSFSKFARLCDEIKQNYMAQSERR